MRGNEKLVDYVLSDRLDVGGLVIHPDDYQELLESYNAPFGGATPTTCAGVPVVVDERVGESFMKVADPMWTFVQQLTSSDREMVSMLLDLIKDYDGR